MKKHELKKAVAAFLCSAVMTSYAVPAFAASVGGGNDNGDPDSVSVGNNSSAYNISTAVGGSSLATGNASTAVGAAATN